MDKFHMAPELLFSFWFYTCPRRSLFLPGLSTESWILSFRIQVHLYDTRYSTWGYFDLGFFCFRVSMDTESLITKIPWLMTAKAELHRREGEEGVGRLVCMLFRALYGIVGRRLRTVVCFSVLGGASYTGFPLPCVCMLFF